MPGATSSRGGGSEVPRELHERLLQLRQQRRRRRGFTPTSMPMPARAASRATTNTGFDRVVSVDISALRAGFTASAAVAGAGGDVPDVVGLPLVERSDCANSCRARREMTPLMALVSCYAAGARSCWTLQPPPARCRALAAPDRSADVEDLERTRAPSASPAALQKMSLSENVGPTSARDCELKHVKCRAVESRIPRTQGWAVGVKPDRTSVLEFT